jgi:uncharacterized membrane protein
MFGISLWYLLVAVVAFIAGALVFRNNPEKGEAAAKLLEEQLAAAIQKAKDLEAQISAKQ